MTLWYRFQRRFGWFLCDIEMRHWTHHQKKLLLFDLLVSTKTVTFNEFKGWSQSSGNISVQSSKNRNLRQNKYQSRAAKTETLSRKNIVPEQQKLVLIRQNIIPEQQTCHPRAAKYSYWRTNNDFVHFEGSNPPFSSSFPCCFPSTYMLQWHFINETNLKGKLDLWFVCCF